MVLPVPGTSAPIEPETSITISTLAGLRSSAQLRRIWSSTCGVGALSVVAGCFGSRPLPVVMRSPGFWSKDRKAYFSNSFCLSGAWRYFRKSAAAAFFVASAQDSTAYGWSEKSVPSLG